MHDPPIERVPPASRRDPKQGTQIGQGGQARRLPDRQQAYGSPAPTTMRAGYSDGSNSRVRQYGPARIWTATRTTSSPPTWPPAPDGRAFGIAADAYSIRCMAGLYEVEIEPEVRSWLSSLSDRDFGRADFLVACSPSTPKISASHTPAILAASSGSCASTCYASRPGSPTGSRPAGG